MSAWWLVILLLSAPVWADGVIVDPYYEYRKDTEHGIYDYDDSQDIPWIENETEVLAAPKNEDLVPVPIDHLPDGMQLLADESRITVGEEDRVIRLWLVVRSEAGAENGSFEGYRCESLQYKVYAYANPNRKPPVSKAKRPVWRDVGRIRGTNYRAELLRHYFCGMQGTLKPHEIRAAFAGDVHHDYYSHH